MAILQEVLKFVEGNLSVIVAAVFGYLFGNVILGAFKAVGNGLKALSK